MSDPDERGAPDAGGGQYIPPPDPPAPPPPSAYEYPPATGGQAPKTEGTAIAALVVGIVGLLVFGIILGVLALVLANQADKKIKASNGTLAGQGMVTAARVIGVIDIVLAIIVIIAVISSN